MVRSLFTLTTDAENVDCGSSMPGIHIEVVTCAVASEAKSAVERTLDILAVGGV